MVCTANIFLIQENPLNHLNPASALALVSIWHHKLVNCGLPYCSNSEKTNLSKSSGQFLKGGVRINSHTRAAYDYCLTWY